MKKLVLCGAIAALVVPATPAAAAKKPLDSCRENHLTSKINKLQKRHLRCSNARTVVTTVEQQAQNCRPYREETVAPFRECKIVPVLTTGEREFTCRSAWEVPGEQKRWWKTVCRSSFGDVVKWRRDGNALAR